jgi:hypothetical protein
MSTSLTWPGVVSVPSDCLFGRVAKSRRGPPSFGRRVARNALALTVHRVPASCTSILRLKISSEGLDDVVGASSACKAVTSSSLASVCLERSSKTRCLYLVQGLLDMSRTLRAVSWVRLCERWWEMIRKDRRKAQEPKILTPNSRPGG